MPNFVPIFITRFLYSSTSNLICSGFLPVFLYICSFISFLGSKKHTRHIVPIPGKTRLIKSSNISLNLANFPFLAKYIKSWVNFFKGSKQFLLHILIFSFVLRDLWVTMKPSKSSFLIKNVSMYNLVCYNFLISS